MIRDTTPTAVVTRPVAQNWTLTHLFSKKQPHVTFVARKAAKTYACADATIISAKDGVIELYAELPSMTVRIKYTGLQNIWVMRGAKVKDGEELGQTELELRFEMTRLPDGEPVKPEFFYEAPPPEIMHGYYI